MIWPTRRIEKKKGMTALLQASIKEGSVVEIIREELARYKQYTTLVVGLPIVVANSKTSIIVEEGVLTLLERHTEINALGSTFL